MTSTGTRRSTAASPWKSSAGPRSLRAWTAARVAGGRQAAQVAAGVAARVAANSRRRHKSSQVSSHRQSQAVAIVGSHRRPGVIASQQSSSVTSSRCRHQAGDHQPSLSSVLSSRKQLPRPPLTCHRFNHQTKPTEMRTNSPPLNTQPSANQPANADQFATSQQQTNQPAN